jgi:hypothetical protein
MNVEQLRELWRQKRGQEPPAALSKDLIARALAYWLQEEVLGGLDARVRKLLGASSSREGPPARHLKVGSVDWVPLGLVDMVEHAADPAPDVAAGDTIPELRFEPACLQRRSGVAPFGDFHARRLYIEVSGRTAGIVASDSHSNSFNFFSAAPRFNAIEGQRFSDPLAAEHAARMLDKYGSVHGRDAS